MRCGKPLIRHPIHGEDCKRDRPCHVHEGDPETEMRINRVNKMRWADKCEEAGRQMVLLDKEYLVLERRKVREKP